MKILLKFIAKTMNFFLSKNQWEIYTDGSFKEGWGRWAYVILKNGKVIQEKSGRSQNTDSNQMEFQAAIEALRLLPPKSRAKIFTDSRILIERVTVLAPTWEEFGWVKKRGQPIPLLERTQILHDLNQKHSLEWKWVRAHSGNTFNERCDWLCRNEIKS